MAMDKRKWAMGNGREEMGNSKMRYWHLRQIENTGMRNTAYRAI